MNQIDYRNKALKYKLKYLELKNKFNKNIIGGLPNWYTKFENELVNIYNNVKYYYTTDYEPILTGSSVITLLLFKLNMMDELDKLESNDLNPHDLDFLYISRTRLSNPDSIGNFYINPTQKSESSVTFNLNINSPERQTNYIKSFDITKSESIKSFMFNGIRIINLNTLKSFYIPDMFVDEERIKKDLYKKKLIEQIIKKIGEEGRLHEFGLDDNVTKRPKRGLFGDYDDEDD
jgi:hypothetical protein